MSVVRLLLFTALLLAATLSAGGCEQRISRQPKYEIYEAAEGFPQGQSALPSPEHVVPYRSLESETKPKVVYTLARLEKGRERFNIYCAPCHGRAGDGNGPVVQHGFPAPPSYHNDRLRSVSDRHFVEIIENGHGIMYSYADRVTADERWAIAAYIRALQVSRHLDIDTAPELVPELAETAEGTVDD